jgi:hypothetical protein
MGTYSSSATDSLLPQPYTRAAIFFFLASVPAMPQAAGLFGFEPNIGQFPPAVRFARRSSDRTMYIVRDAIVLPLGVRIQIGGIDTNADPEGDTPTATRYNFFQGSDSSRWRTNVRLFGAVRWSNAYPGISAVFSAQNAVVGPAALGQGKITISVQRGADFARFRLRVLNIGAPPSGGPEGYGFPEAAFRVCSRLEYEVST